MNALRGRLPGVARASQLLPRDFNGDGRTASSAVSEGLVAGQYRVMISATRPATPQEIAAMKAADDEWGQVGDDDEGESEAQAKSEPVMIQYIPAKYGRGSELTVEITPGENTKDFDLTP